MVNLENVDPDRITQGLLKVAAHVKIAHHIPGRVRLKISLPGLTTAQEVDWDNMVGSIPGVLSLRINPFALSAIIEYDEDQLPYDLWEDIAQVDGKPERAEKVSARLHSLFER